jgi:hypothetical protein
MSAAESPNAFISSLVNVLKDIQKSKALKKLSILRFTFTWLSQKMETLLKRGLHQSKFEDLRSAGISFMEDRDITDQEKQVIIELIVNLKNASQVQQPSKKI